MKHGGVKKKRNRNEDEGLVDTPGRLSPRARVKRRKNGVHQRLKALRRMFKKKKRAALGGKGPNRSRALEIIKECASVRLGDTKGTETIIFGTKRKEEKAEGL